MGWRGKKEIVFDKHGWSNLHLMLNERNINH